MQRPSSGPACLIEAHTKCCASAPQSKNTSHSKEPQKTSLTLSSTTQCSTASLRLLTIHPNDPIHAGQLTMAGNGRVLACSTSSHTPIPPGHRQLLQEPVAHPTCTQLLRLELLGHEVHGEVLSTYAVINPVFW